VAVDSPAILRYKASEHVSHLPEIKYQICFITSILRGQHHRSI